MMFQPRLEHGRDGYTNSDHGIDGDIKFKDDQDLAYGNRLYLQLRSGDSYLKKRVRDDTEVFQIKNERWVDNWQHQAYAADCVTESMLKGVCL